jgi:isopenicillin-N epimerase
MKIDRRTALVGAAALPLAGNARARIADDDAYWAGIAAQYDVTRDVIQLEHGNWGMMPRPVAAAYRGLVDRVNRDTSLYARRGMAGDLDAARGAFAASLGAEKNEIAFSRNATEAMKALILGYNRLKPGDAVLIADLDYDSMQALMASLVRSRGVRVVRIALPEPATHQGLIDAYDAAFRADPAIRLALLTHVSHRTGLVLPIAEIVRAARARNVETIVDAAHGIGQLDIDLPGLGADFVGMNLHKWVGAPLGVGALYIKRDRLGDIDPDPAEDPAHAADIRARVHTGTVDFAAQLTVPQAIAFNQAIGAKRRAERLRALRNRWADAVADLPGIQLLTPADPRLHGAITSFRLAGQTSHDQNVALAKRLLDAHRIFTVHRDGVASGSCVRVTPGLMTAMADMDALAAALRALATG